MALLIAFYTALDPSLNSSFFAELPLVELWSSNPPFLNLSIEVRLEGYLVRNILF
jgi:hypothetical protein